MFEKKTNQLHFVLLNYFKFRHVLQNLHIWINIFVQLIWLLMYLSTTRFFDILFFGLFLPHHLTLWLPVLLSYRNQSIDLHSKSIDWFLYDGNTSNYWFNLVALCDYFFCFIDWFLEWYRDFSKQNQILMCMGAEEGQTFQIIHR